MTSLGSDRISLDLVSSWLPVGRETVFYKRLFELIQIQVLPDLLALERLFPWEDIPGTGRVDEAGYPWRIVVSLPDSTYPKNTESKNTFSCQLELNQYTES